MRRRGQRGTVVNRNGVWTGMWREYVALPDGSQRSTLKAKAFPGMSERAAWNAMQPILYAVNKSNASPKTVPIEEPTLLDAVAEWRRLAAVNLKPRGRRAAESHLHAHILPKLGTTKMSELDQRAIQSFVADITPGRNGKTVENIVSTLSSIVRHVRRWNWNVPAISIADLSMPECVKSSTPRMLTAAQIMTLIEKADEPLKTILFVLALTGLRINEALGLTLADLDFDEKTIHVRHSAYRGTLGTPKSEASKADVPMPDVLVEKLQAYISSPQYRKNPKELLFCNRRMRPMSDDKLRVMHLTPLLKSLKMNRAGVKFHAFRHAVASELISQGTPITAVRDQLRHSDVRVTLAVYGHTIGNAQREAVNKLASRFIA
jgi:integrase